MCGQWGPGDDTGRLPGLRYFRGEMFKMKFSFWIVTLTVVSWLWVNAALAAVQCGGTHCDVLPARLLTAAESCASQIFDDSQTSEYSQLRVGARDFSTFPFSTIYPVGAYDSRLDGSYSNDDPGWNAVPNPCAQAPLLGPLPPFAELYIDFLPEMPTAGGVPRNLLYWDPVDTNGDGLDPSDVVWTPVVLDEILRFDNKTGVTVAADGSENAIEGVLIDETGASGNIHFHADWDLRRRAGGLPTIGVYMIKAQVSMPNFAEVELAYFAFATVGTSPTAQRVAIEQIENDLVFAFCDDGVDNDQDGLVDFAGGDPGCTSASDDSEKSPDFECDDGIDNDGDGFIDYRAVDFGAANLYADRDPECDGQGAAGISEAPEPGAAAMLISGITLLTALGRRRARITGRCRA